MIGGWRRRVERIEGLTLDALLIAAAVAVSEDSVQEWLLGHPPALYHGLALLHAVAVGVPGHDLCAPCRPPAVGVGRPRRRATGLDRARQDRRAEALVA